jgi:hypothetical protein
LSAWLDIAQWQALSRWQSQPAIAQAAGTGFIHICLTINQPKEMKTPNLPLSAILLPPIALLLCQCASTQPTGALTTTAIPVAAPAPALATLLNKAWAAREASEPLPSAPADPAGSEADASLALTLPPLVVTGDLNSAFLDGMRYWPTDPADAAEKKALIGLPQPEPAPVFPLGESGEAWLKSQR